MNPNVRSYAVITGAYWVFTLTDGALRTLILLHLHSLGYTAWEVAVMFLGYEFFGVVTNLVGGWLAARTGLKTTLFIGLGLQIVACSALALISPLTVVLVMSAQALSGIAKDMTKMSAKSYIKLVVPKGQEHGLMKWVALLTGSKNTLKGVGFFLGGFMLATLGFANACWVMIAALVSALLLSVLLLPGSEGKVKDKVPFKSLFSNTPAINWLALARFFLFASRDVWFVIAVPLYLSMELGWSPPAVSGFLASWIIAYGFVQAAAPKFVGTQTAEGGASAVSAKRLGLWTTMLVLPLGLLLGGLQTGIPPASLVVSMLGVYGIVFAANSAIHSYLIVSYAEGDKVAMRVGFYYMANAAGRLIGTILSGALFQMAGMGEAGLVACIGGSIAFAIASGLVCVPLHRATQ